jgi:uncharacterized phage-like protein YoqJ
MNDLNKTACFTGHRPQKCGGFDERNPIADNIKAKLIYEIEVLIQKGYINFISGGALGVDQWAAQIVIDLKEKYPQIKLIMARPFPSQDSKWFKKSQDHFKYLCEKSDQVIDVNLDPYSAWKMQARNEYMINSSSVVIAVFDGTSGGTANAVNFAKAKNKNIILITPKKY